MSLTPESIVVRPAAESDSREIARLQHLCPEAAPWPVGDYSAFQLLLALADSRPAGFCAWRQISPEEAELLNLGVDPAHRRQGIASALLKALRAAAVGEIFLEVAAPNTAARALYQSCGWISTGVRKGYYDRGRTDAVVMKISSC